MTQFTVDAAEAIRAETHACKAVSIIGQTMQMKHPGLPTYFELAAIAVRNLADAGLKIVPMAVMDNVVALTPAGEDAIRKFVDAVDLTQAAVSAGSDALEQAIEADEGRYVYDLSGRDHAVDPLALAVRDAVEVSRLLNLAAATLGREAVDTLLQVLTKPAPAAT